jgi:hypothetical protein
LPEDVAIDRVPIAEEVGWRGVVRKRLHDLLGGPGGGRMLGDVEVDDPSPIVGEHDEDEEDAPPRGGHGEEIEGDEVPDVVGEERAPALGRRVCRMLGVEFLAARSRLFEDGIGLVPPKASRPRHRPTPRRREHVRARG